MDDITSRIHLLTEFLHCNGKMFVSMYNDSGTLMETNTSNMIYDTMFRSSKLLDSAINFGKEFDKPLIVTSETRMIWAIVFQKNEENHLLYLHIMGPVFTTALSEESLDFYKKNPSIREKWKPKLIKYLKNIPVVTGTDLFKYTLMLHYAVNNVYLKPSDITLSHSGNEEYNPPKQKGIDYAAYWAMENNMLQFIRTGGIYYKNKIPSAASALQNFYPASDSEIDLTKQYATIFIGLAIRAAIDGGITPDTSYHRGGIYLQNLISANTMADLLSITHAAFEDFLFLVHNHQEKPAYSNAISACIDYIETHTDEPINIALLSSKIGYSKYYLSKKFKEEVGMSINSYIKKARIDRACYLLVSSKMDIQEISDLLHFGNRNFFTKVFKEETGTNPAAFRDSHQKKL